MPEKEKLRIDKYLWAIRLFKTRTLATEACKAGRVKLDGQNIKPAHEVKIGEIYQVSKGIERKVIKVTGLLENRMDAKSVVDFYDDETPIENRLISKSLEGAQKKVEGFHFDQRKNVVQYDDVMNRHRKAIYAMRKEILRQPEIRGRIKTMIDDEVAAAASSPQLTSEGFDDQLREVFPFDEATLDRLFDSELSKFETVLKAAAHELYNAREEAFGKEVMRAVEREIYLQVLDNLWMQHLENMDHLREGIHWMAVGQQDPLVEYRRRSQLYFEEMQNTLRHDVLRSLFHAEPVDQSELNRPTETELTRAARGSISNAGQINRDLNEFDEKDFSTSGTTKAAQPKAKKPTNIKKARKNERKRKTAARRRK